MRAGGTTLPCALGRGGIAMLKREGDGATPLSAMTLERAYLAGRHFRKASRLPLAATRDDLGWCDAVGDRNYNRPVRLPYAASHEAMRRGDGLYDCCIVLDWNLRPRRRGAGSAIFLHIARPGFAPTEGCVAVSRRAMAWLLPRISRRTVLTVVR